ncbi:hypothetical protein WA026_005412 [Henosepilachna vigintioctopunctata]|uniref:CHK kinase-like domain-containing protein n=1 Tax=Henosepilachna vigintioctopunctata TaxID=420089 RepID=A0AAW1TUW3_9CUCU
MSTKETLQNVTKELMKIEGVEEYELHIEGDSEKGGNFLGDVTFFSIVPNNGQKEYNLVMKTAKTSNELRKSLPLGKAYEREAFMYQQMIPEFRKFIKSIGAAVEIDYVPKVLWCEVEEKMETLILENLNNVGYRVLDSTKPLNLDHVLVVLRTLGKHHALSIAMKDKSPEKFEGMTKDLSKIWIHYLANTFTNTFFKPAIERASKVLEERGRKDLASKLDEKLKENIVSLLLRETPAEDKIVVCHGDCWNNNILFKYKGSEQTTPSGLYFVDYQLSMLETPIDDLSFFLYTSCDKSVLDQFDLLLQTYYNSLASTVKMFGCELEKYLTLEKLMDQWKEYGATGLIIATLLLRIELLKPDEAPDLTEIVENGNDTSEAFCMKIDNEDLYDNRILDIFSHFAERFL